MRLATARRDQCRNLLALLAAQAAVSLEPDGSVRLWPLSGVVLITASFLKDARYPVVAKVPVPQNSP